MPRALTEQEKCRLCGRLLEKGKDVVFAQGVRKTSVDEIAKAAGMAKGSFYQHFESKEKYLYELIMEQHRLLFAKAAQMIQATNDYREGIRGVLMSLFHMPEMIFFVKNYREIDELFESMPDPEAKTAHQIELELYENLLSLAGIDSERVKPGVVNNYVHTLFMAMASEMMFQDDLPETVELLMDGLVSYIFGGRS
jgi:AcrR family transcriptional regulator